MKDTPLPSIISMINNQKNFFSGYYTRSTDFRIDMLKLLKTAILKNEHKLTDALWADLHKSYEEAYLTEISIVLQEIDNHIRHLNKWVKPKRVKTPVALFPSSSRIIYEPLGVALIIAPWNYPFQLLMNPLVGAISSGCCAILKPSPHSPETAQVMEEMIRETFRPDYISVVQGGRNVNKNLLDQRFDVIFFSGSPSLGKIVMKAAAEHLTPVILELGGKNPCIVDKDADIKTAAKRIAWGKTINAGQSCIAPDYIFAHHSIQDELISEMADHILKMYGPEIKENPYYPRIVNNMSVERIRKLMMHGKIVFGGEIIPDEKYIAPTIIKNVLPDYPVMQEEIFGPVIPVLVFSDISEVIGYINSKEKPLALYYFGSKKTAKKVLLNTSSGGGCINDTIMHIANHHLPFGGTGNSGMGRYHGFNSFKAFCNQRSFVYSPTCIDIPLRYPPFKNFNLLKKLF